MTMTPSTIMKPLYSALMMTALNLLTSCSVKPVVIDQFQLTAFSAQKIASTPSHETLLITSPEAVDGYQTNQMQYMITPFKLNSFTKNSWFSPPASMLYPLLIQSLQQSGYFYAVGSGSYVNKTDYRLDTQLLALQQNFITKPSILELKTKVILTRVSNNHIMGSRTFNLHIPCPQDSPYGGVVAANNATQILTKKITSFVISKIRDRKIIQKQ